MSVQLERIAAFYDSLVERHGHHPRACDYGRAESQAIKFKVLSEVQDLTGRRVLDIGCGFADYAAYLHGCFQGLTYTGIDVSTRMVTEARRLHPDIEVRQTNILETPIAGTFDVVTANGIFYLLGAEAPALTRQLIAIMYSKAEQAVAFNSLSAWCLARDPGEYYADPMEMLEYCRSLTPCVVLRHDYHARDFTVYMYRSQVAA